MTGSSVRQFIPLRISWCGHKSMWPVAFDAVLWLFIYSSKERGVKMPAYMTAGVVATVVCVSVHNTSQAHTIDRAAPAKSYSSKLAAFQ